METIILSQVNVNDFFEQMRNILREEIRQILHEELQADAKSKTDNKLLSAAEAAEMLKVSLVTLWAWAKQGKIIKHKLSGKIYFKYSDLMQAVDMRYKHVNSALPPCSNA
jgi:excisionase family DNA binding protein